MVPKSLRITRDKDIKKALYGRAIVSTSFVRVIMLGGQTDFKLLVIVPKKQLKRAHDRATIRRRIQAVFGEMLLQKKVPSNMWCVVRVTNKMILKLAYKDLQNDLTIAVGTCYHKSLGVSKSVDKRPKNNVHS